MLRFKCPAIDTMDDFFRSVNPHVRSFVVCLENPCLSGVVFFLIFYLLYAFFPKRQDEARKKGRWSAGFSTIIHFPSLQGLSNLLLS